jgi:peptide/nickel transport system permease protein
MRILRANLLDELNKPYVITARAKGVKPLKLLVKYPLRIAINPFISTIGFLLPTLISGEAIVSIVLNLPTTGPALVQALINQDMYLAGSFLMLLSILTIVGMLISDLLLAWADPRIRYE